MVDNFLSVKLYFFKNLRIGLKDNLGPGLPAFSHLPDFGFGFPSGVFLIISLTVAAHLHSHPFRESANH